MTGLAFFGFKAEPFLQFEDFIAYNQLITNNLKNRKKSKWNHNEMVQL